jgi:hypothetical protein
MRSHRRQQAFSAAILVSLLCAATAVVRGQGSANSSSSPVPAAQSKRPDPSLQDQVVIPGPLRSFLRMAGISQMISPEAVLPAVARNVQVLGYQQGRVTEYLLLLERYVHQARELQAMAGPASEIRVARCEDAEPLLQVLGYRLHGACGQKDASLMTNNPEIAFLTIDSGFPLTRLEQALVTNTPFVYPYRPSPVPALFRQSDWTNMGRGKRSTGEDLLDMLMHDPQVARLYSAFSRMDPETRIALRSAGLWGLLQNANVLDFYGTQLCIRSNKVLVPGGPGAAVAWGDLVGASTASPSEFVTRLISQDHGWMAAYFDTMSRLDQKQQAHFTQGSRLKELYDAFREQDPNAPAAGASFRKAPELLVLFTRQQWMPNGEPRIPGTPDTWKQIAGKHARRMNHPEQVLEAMVSYSRMESYSGPLQIYLTLSEVDSHRPAQRTLSPETMLLMAHNYADYSSWYPVFAEFPELTDASISRFIKVARQLDQMSNQQLRGNALGIYQADLGLWQILARQGEIPKDQLDASWQKVIEPFEQAGSPPQLFDAGSKSLDEITIAASGKAHRSQDEIIDLLAGPPQKNPQAERVRLEVAGKMRNVIDDQRLTSLETLIELSNGLIAMEHGTPASKNLIALAGGLREFEMPRPIFTESEKDQWSPGVYSQRHAEVQIRTDLAKTIEQPNPPAKLEAARGQLASFLRDTLVGLNYAYYEPPGSQILHINPLFVRSHDFAGETIVGEEHVWQAPSVFGKGSAAGGGAYLVGSLAGLPYVLADAEQDFIAPEHIQALIWQEIVPDLLANASVSRWWNVSPHELHAVALYQQSGEEILAASAGNPQLRDKVLTILSNRMSPQRLTELQEALQSKNVQDEISRLLPADTFYLAAEFRERFPQEAAGVGPASQTLDKLCRQYPADASLERISKDFGIPHPELTQNYGRELVNVKPFPAFSGYSSGLFGESWDYSNLYWARLADERNDSPAALNVLCPQLTRLMVSKIFASDYEDWPAVVRAMRETGDDYLQGKVAVQTGTETAQR